MLTDSSRDFFCNSSVVNLDKDLLKDLLLTILLIFPNDTKCSSTESIGLNSVFSLSQDKSAIPNRIVKIFFIKYVFFIVANVILIS